MCERERQRQRERRGKGIYTNTVTEQVSIHNGLLSSRRGTHGYMAPEVIKKGVQYTYTSDWFSLGCVLYKLLRG